MPRQAIARWRALVPPGAEQAPLSAAAERTRQVLQARGACFLDDLVRGSGLVPTEVELALGELVSRGLVGSDGFSGLRALSAPARARAAAHARYGGHPPRTANAIASAGRWTLFPTKADPSSPEDVEAIAWTLLRRWGVVFRRVIDREGALPPWRDLLRCYRRLEARGEIRGGRFVTGFAGELYALPDAVARLRAIRKQPHDGTLIAVSAADPLNIVGLLTPGDTVSALAGNRILFCDGLAVAVREAASTSFLAAVAERPPHELELALLRRRLVPGCAHMQGRGRGAVLGLLRKGQRSGCCGLGEVSAWTQPSAWSP